MSMTCTVKSFLTHSLLLITSLQLVACGGGGSKATVKPVSEPVVVVTPTQFDYQAAINNTISDNVPGVVLYIEKPDFTFLGSAGVADVDEQIAMETYHVMPTGSAGKKLTALLAVMLDEEGVLKLDDTIDNWLSDELLSQIEHSENITLRQLLNHTSGIYDYLDSETASDFYDALLASDLEQLKTDAFALPFGLGHPAYSLPGDEFHYSNTGYLLVGLILDNILGEHHSTAIRNRILNPFGMNSSFYGGVEKSLGDIISGYFTDDEYGTINTKLYFENLGVADAPLRSNVEDLAFLLKSIVNSQDHVSEYIKKQMFGENHLVELNSNQSYGLGIFKEIINGKVVYHHGGLEPGYTTSNIYIPETQTSITAFFNCGLDEQCEKESDILIETVLSKEL